jgi:hypothetical protein
MEMVRGWRDGLRWRRVPVYYRIKGKHQMMKGPLDPCKFHARGGDWVTFDVNYHMYENEGKRGGTINMDKIFMFHQASNEMSQEVEAEGGGEDMPDMEDRFATPAEPVDTPKTSDADGGVSTGGALTKRPRSDDSGADWNAAPAKQAREQDQDGFDYNT